MQIKENCLDCYFCSQLQKGCYCTVHKQVLPSIKDNIVMPPDICVHSVAYMKRFEDWKKQG